MEERAGEGVFIGKFPSLILPPFVPHGGEEIHAW